MRVCMICGLRSRRNYTPGDWSATRELKPTNLIRHSTIIHWSKNRWTTLRGVGLRPGKMSSVLNFFHFFSAEPNIALGKKKLDYRMRVVFRLLEMGRRTIRHIHLSTQLHMQMIWLMTKKKSMNLLRGGIWLAVRRTRLVKLLLLMFWLLKKLSLLLVCCYILIQLN